MIHLERLAAHNFKQLREIDLVFPRRGRILVQGLNEAGKSTLFEAVFFGLFGKPLATESGRANLEDLVHYGSEEAFVGLDLGLGDGRRLSLARRIRRGRPNVWELDILGPGEAVEEIRGNNEVNARVEAELGFDGEALLNTCFVEQKKLEKLEGMGRAQREQSLMKLLNLDRLLELGERFKVKRSDEADLARLADRARLAALQAEIPRLEAGAAELVARVRRAELHAGLVTALSGLDELQRSAEVLTAAQARAAALVERATKARSLAEGMARWEAGLAARGRAVEAKATLTSLRAELTEARGVAETELPEITRRGQALRRYERRRAWLDGLAAEREQLEGRIAERELALTRLAEGLQILNTTRRELVEARGAGREAIDALRPLEQDRRAFDVREAMIEWLAAVEARSPLAGGGDALAEARSRRQRQSARTRLLGGAFLAAGVALVGLALAVFGLWGAAPLFLLLLGLASLGWLGLGAMAFAIWRAGQALAVEIGRLEGEASVAEREAERLAAREAEAVARLGQLQAIQPGDADRGRAFLAELDQRLGERGRAEVEAELEAARERGARARAQAESLEKREAELRDAVRGQDGAALGTERDAWAARAARIEAALQRRAPRVRALAAELGLDGDRPQSLADEMGSLRERYGALRRQVERIPSLEVAIGEAEARAESQSAEARRAWESLPAEIERPDAPDEAVWQDVGQALQAAYEAAGGNALAAERDRAERASAELAGRHAAARAGLERELARLARESVALGQPLEVRLPEQGGQEPELAGFEAARSSLIQIRDALAPEDGRALEALVAERDQRRSELDLAGHDRRRLETALGLAGQLIDLEEAEGAHRAGARSIALRTRAADIVSHAGRNVVQRILPSTIEHMRRLLPTMTEQRYFDAQLGDDYRIQVYDDRAGAWKMKNIFSGGTRDQLSLALRLAFALATLPEERGSAPSFLFLDEPLSAFDSERARALIHLLTEGEIASSFDQIFLISHVRVDAGLFDHRILMEEGRVVESDLQVEADVVVEAEVEASAVAEGGSVEG